MSSCIYSAISHLILFEEASRTKAKSSAAGTVAGNKKVRTANGSITSVNDKGASNVATLGCPALKPSETLLCLQVLKTSGLRSKTLQVGSRTWNPLLVQKLRSPRLHMLVTHQSQICK